MLETPHVLVGAAIATYIPNPLIAIPLSFASHFVIEFVPHWNPHLNAEKKKYGKITSRSLKIIIMDSFLALFLGLFFATRVLPNYNHFLTIILSCFASVVPDLIEAPYFFLNINKKFLLKWVAFQKKLQNDANIYWGLATQLITAATAIWWILQSH